MFCPRCGTEIKEGHKFCAKCGTPATGTDTAKAAPPATKNDFAPTQEPEKKTAKKVPEPVAAPAPAPAPAPAAAPAPAPAPAKPVLDVKDIVKSPPKIMAVEETINFKGAEHALENEGLKTKAFSGVFSSAAAHEVRVESIVRIYEPVHMVRAVYEGTFEVAKEFNLALDPDTTKVEIDGKVHEVKPVASGGGLFGGGGSTSLKLVGTETVKKRVEKGNYYDMNGVQKNNLEMHIKGKKTTSFNPTKQQARTTILGTKFDASHLTDKVLTPEIIQRQQNAKKMVKERITVDVQTVYYPKYKALVTNLKNQQQKYLIISAVDKQLFNTETF